MKNLTKIALFESKRQGLKFKIKAVRHFKSTSFLHWIKKA
jgi:hypothetical protein